MILDFGKYSGRSAQQVLFAHPCYVNWLLQKRSLQGSAAVVASFWRECLEKFNKLPYKVSCELCEAPAKKLTVPIGAIASKLWCQSCNPYSLQARSGSLVLIVTYKDAVEHVQTTCTRLDLARKIVRTMAKAKGLRGQFTNKAISQFLGLL